MREFRKITNTARVPVKAWIDGVQMEAEAAEQIGNVASLPFIHKHVAIMPDVHWGQGATIGSVIPTKRAIVPAAVGVDIGCGMAAALTNLRADQLPDSLAEIRSAIEAAVPHGRTADGGRNDVGAHQGDVPGDVAHAFVDLAERLVPILEDDPKLEHQRTLGQLGTLGTGNHFIEVCLDLEDRVWVMLHSGSRGPGNRIGTYFIKQAKREMERWFVDLPDKALAYLPEASPLFPRYWRALSWAQTYAWVNRALMMKATLEALDRALPGFDLTYDQNVVSCHHNYVAKEHHFGENVWVTRKGAVRAREGDLGIIPGSMGARSFIVRGKGNRDSFHSCSHGAGRAMSRRAARKRFSIEDHEAATAGIECRKDSEVLDETPGAYKSIEAVMAAQEDLVEVVHELRQVVCVKG